MSAERLRTAMREQALAWRRESIAYASRADRDEDAGAPDVLVTSSRAHAARLRMCAEQIEALAATEAVS